MTLQDKMINVEIQVGTGITDPNGVDESISRKEKGSYLRKGNLHLLKYNEEIEGFGEIITTFIIQDNKITLKREGAVKMHQVFRIGKSTECVYRHPHGQFRMETTTHQMKYLKGQENKSGKLFVEYDVSLNEDEPRLHQLELEFYEEEK
ncbi:DUF1934 domain-containing protein [Halalkalibacillus halophilus]|uniref:DUF1934 domain-containing protein n=1 Tax=Halalkalibacillus halophilus TaxID=392827 RepID=UPI0003F5384D|nr:DUF1934 domain-containing protein [Halalkalibacillus halophilus]